MNRNLAIALSVFAIMYFGTLIVVTSDEIEFELPFANGEEKTGTDYKVDLEDGIAIDDTVKEIPHPLTGTIQTSEDGKACWIVTEVIGVLYYKEMECSGNV